MKKLYIEEYNLDRQSVVIDRKIYEDRVYDPNLNQEFYVMKEPDWMHIQPDKIYIYRMAEMEEPYYDATEMIFVRLWRRIDENTIIVGFWDMTNNSWLKEDTEESGIPTENETVMNIDEYTYIQK